MNSLLNWFKYSKYELRSLQYPCVPKGPQFSSAHSVTCLLAGNQLKLNLPKHMPLEHTPEQLKPKGDSVLDFPFRKASADVMGDDNWKFASSLSRTWQFYAPWFSGSAASLSVCIDVASPIEPVANTSYFHPRVFEQVVAAFLTSSYAHEETLGTLDWMAPVNWQRVSSFPVVAAQFDVQPINHRNTTPLHKYLFPVGDHYLAMVSFRYEQNCTGSREEKNQKISREPMWELINNILDSMTLTLSSETQAKVDKIKAECPDYSLSETFPPLKWPVDGNTADQPPEPLKIHAS